MYNMCATYLQSTYGPMGPGPKRRLGPWVPRPGTLAHAPKARVPRRLFGLGPMGPYVFCTYVAHMLYIILIYFIVISYLFHISAFSLKTLLLVRFNPYNIVLRDQRLFKLD